jgi:uncharacterized protein YycO
MYLPDFIEFLIDQKGKPYDYTQAIGSAFDGIFPDNSTDFSKLFCSELICAAYQASFKKSHVIQKRNPSEETPKDLISYPIYKAPTQILGTPTELFR